MNKSQLLYFLYLTLFSKGQEVSKGHEHCVAALNILNRVYWPPSSTQHKGRGGASVRQTRRVTQPGGGAGLDGLRSSVNDAESGGEG